MNEKENQQQIIERVLESLKEADGRKNLNDLIRQQYLHGDATYYLATVRRMEIKGLVKKENEEGVYNLTDYGWTFQGFEKEKLEAEEIKKLEKEQKQSVIDTNDSVRVTNRISRRTNRTSVAIASITGIFIASSYFKDASKGPKSIYIQLAPTGQIQDTLKQSLQANQPVQVLTNGRNDSLHKNTTKKKSGK